MCLLSVEPRSCRRLPARANCAFFYFLSVLRSFIGSGFRHSVIFSKLRLTYIGTVTSLVRAKRPQPRQGRKKDKRISFFLLVSASSIVVIDINSDLARILHYSQLSSYHLILLDFAVRLIITRLFHFSFCAVAYCRSTNDFYAHSPLQQFNHHHHNSAPSSHHPSSFLAFIDIALNSPVKTS